MLPVEFVSQFMSVQSGISVKYGVSIILHSSTEMNEKSQVFTNRGRKTVSQRMSPSNISNIDPGVATRSPKTTRNACHYGHGRGIQVQPHSLATWLRNLLGNAIPL